MPNSYITLPDTVQSVVRPIVYQVLDQLNVITKKDNEYRVQFLGPSDAMQSNGSNIHDPDNRDAQFQAAATAFVEVVEDYEKGAMQEIYVFGDETPSIFHDAALGIYYRPVYATSNIELRVRYRSTSETEVERWIAEQLIKTSRGRDTNLNALEYLYPIPLEYVGFLDTIWMLREAQEGYGDSFRQYVMSHVSQRVTFQSDMAGENVIMSVKDIQKRIVGQFDFQGVPEKPIRNKDSGTWETSFVFKFSYQRPVALAITYPLCIHGQFIPDAFLPKPTDVYDPDERATYHTRSYEALALFELGKPFRPRQSKPYPRIPDFDDFIIPRPHPSTGTFLTTLCFLDDGKQDLVSLRDLGDFIIDDDILEYLVGEAPYLSTLYTSLFYITHYEEGVLKPGDSIEVTPELMVRAKAPLSHRNVHRVRFSMVPDLLHLQFPAVERLRNYPKAFIKVFSALNEIVAIDPDLQLWGSRPIEDWQLSYIYWVITGRSAPGGYFPITDGSAMDYIDGINPKDLEEYRRYQSNVPRTVQTSYVVARKQPIKQ